MSKVVDSIVLVVLPRSRIDQTSDRRKLPNEDLTNLRRPNTHPRDRNGRQRLLQYVLASDASPARSCVASQTEALAPPEPTDRRDGEGVLRPLLRRVAAAGRPAVARGGRSASRPRVESAPAHVRAVPRSTPGSGRRTSSPDRRGRLAVATQAPARRARAPARRPGRLQRPDRLRVSRATFERGVRNAREPRYADPRATT